MLRRQRSGSVVCPSCGRLNSIQEKRCWNCGRANPGMWGFAPALRRLGVGVGPLEIVFGGCAALYLLSLVADLQGIRMEGLFTFLAPSQESLLRFGASGTVPVMALGRWWTVLSAGWLHSGIVHIGFNLYWVRFLLPPVTSIYGASRTVVLYTLASVCGFVFSTLGYFVPLLNVVLGRGLLTVGASAAVFGLLGALVRAGRRGIHGEMGRQAWIYAVAFMIFGLLFPGVDNWAHLGGFVGGYLAAMWLDPQTPERGDHTLLALLCLAATVASVVASLLVPMA